MSYTVSYDGANDRGNSEFGIWEFGVREFGVSVPLPEKKLRTLELFSTPNLELSTLSSCLHQSRKPRQHNLFVNRVGIGMAPLG